MHFKTSGFWACSQAIHGKFLNISRRRFFPDMILPYFDAVLATYLFRKATIPTWTGSNFYSYPQQLTGIPLESFGKPIFMVWNICSDPAQHRPNIPSPKKNPSKHKRSKGLPLSSFNKETTFHDVPPCLLYNKHMMCCTSNTYPAGNGYISHQTRQAGRWYCWFRSEIRNNHHLTGMKPCKRRAYLPYLLIEKNSLASW